MIKTNYQISGLINPATHMVVAGSVYFQNNLSVQNYALDSAIITSGVLRLSFTPDECLPEHLKQGEHYIELLPQPGVLVVSKTVFNQGDRTHVFYRVIDCIERKENVFDFRVRKYAKHVEGAYRNYDIAYRAGEDGLPEEGFKLVSEQYATRHDIINVYRRSADNV